ncbi:hypothetical protein [uncultured Paraglaciecola sp.]|uniref:hypothetical protein n=1 Tax=uncultured Paraglaciecola sp. TaxID=1765024 RepID=UPI002609C8D0|nr:hypothetical protein [uncultured Paraglaciecola sp.]
MIKTLLITLFAASLGACAISPKTVEVPVSNNWVTVQHEAANAVELKTETDGGTFSTVCTGGTCIVLIEPKSGCLPGVNYPLLVNSIKRMGVISSRCAVLTQEDKSRYVVMIRDNTAILQAMYEEMDISVSFPVQAGGMDVLNVNMMGVRDMLAPLTSLKPQKQLKQTKIGYETL